ncbi:hypothetical protein [Variovorax sp. OV329]|uniref:hypothetical protein n=1 Tax=Variovorax sp. OV329 TaxID=1882825 RepID=UPI0008F10033|nr:hypothetical protein SAMN05444747_107100 [Variovorax sp. OV329]
MIRIFGLLGLVLALVIVGLLLRKQLGTTVAPALPSATGQAAPAAATSNPRQVQEQFKQSLDAAMQQPRALPDEAK